jgi:TolA-binding protein
MDCLRIASLRFPALLIFGYFLFSGPVTLGAGIGLPNSLLKPVEGVGVRFLESQAFLALSSTEVTTSLDLGSVSYDPHRQEQDGHGEAEPDPSEAPAHAEAASGHSGHEQSAEPAGHNEAGITEANAELAIRVGDFDTAALIYAKIVAQTHNEERRKKAYLSLAEVYRSLDDPMRVVSILERFRREYPDEESMPEILLRLGFLYRETGAFQKAVDAFFGVLKQSFNLDQESLTVYRQITQEASYQIAETYYRMHQYELAAEFFTRLLRAARPNTPERLDLLAKCAYANYFSGDFRKVLFLLEIKDWTGIEPSRQAEFRFLRASAFWSMSDRESARSEVINLADLEVEPNKDPYWNFWWKFVGNELANDLFAQQDYAMAHKLYYSLLHLSSEQKWQLPVIFQIGRCHELLGNEKEAQEIYERILGQIEAIEVSAMAGNLVVLKTRVEDQLNDLAWEDELDRAQELYSPQKITPPDERSEPLASLDARGR